MMRKTLFILIVQLFISKINAQSYMGYMGKCNLVNLNFNLGMSPQPQFNNNNGLTYTYFNSKIEGEYEKSINSVNSVGGSLRYMKSTFNTSTFKSDFFDITEYFYGDNSFYSGEAKLKQITFGAYIKHFINKNGGFSPQGKYIQFGINYHLINSTDYHLYYIKGTSSWPNNYNPIKINQIDQSKYASFLLGFGNNKVIKYNNHHFVLNTSICANISGYYSSLLFKGIMAGSSERVTSNPNSFIKIYVSELDFFTFKLGAGYLF
jgi:hypothetical protein